MTPPHRIYPHHYQNIFFASDFHYNHQRDFVWKQRGFESALAHDEFIERECKRLTNKDLLIYLGDFSLNSTESQSYKLLTSIRAQMYYVFGNHEGYHQRLYTAALRKFIETCGSGSATLSHPMVQVFPFSINKETGNGLPGIEGRSNEFPIFDLTYFGEDLQLKVSQYTIHCRHMAPLIWNKMGHPSQLAVFGHSHGNMDHANPHATNPSGKSIDIGVDNAIKHNGTAFFSLNEVLHILEKRTNSHYDHHS